MTSSTRVASSANFEESHKEGNMMLKSTQTTGHLVNGPKRVVSRAQAKSVSEAKGYDSVAKSTDVGALGSSMKLSDKSDTESDNRLSTRDDAVADEHLHKEAKHSSPLQSQPKLSPSKAPGMGSGTASSPEDGKDVSEDGKWNER